MTNSEMHELVNKAIKSTRGTSRDVINFLVGYTQNSNSQLSELLSIIADETFDYDMKYELKL